MIKRVISVLCSVAVLLSVLPYSALAAVWNAPGSAITGYSDWTNTTSNLGGYTSSTGSIGYYDNLLSLNGASYNSETGAIPIRKVGDGRLFIKSTRAVWSGGARGAATCYLTVTYKSGKSESFLLFQMTVNAYTSIESGSQGGGVKAFTPASDIVSAKLKFTTVKYGKGGTLTFTYPNIYYANGTRLDDGHYLINEGPLEGTRNDMNHPPEYKDVYDPETDSSISNPGYHVGYDDTLPKMPGFGGGSSRGGGAGRSIVNAKETFEVDGTLVFDDDEPETPPDSIGHTCYWIEDRDDRPVKVIVPYVKIYCEVNVDNSITYVTENNDGSQSRITYNRNTVVYQITNKSGTTIYNYNQGSYYNNGDPGYYNPGSGSVIPEPSPSDEPSPSPGESPSPIPSPLPTASVTDPPSPTPIPSPTYIPGSIDDAYDSSVDEWPDVNINFFSWIPTEIMTVIVLFLIVVIVVGLAKFAL